MGIALTRDLVAHVGEVLVLLDVGLDAMLDEGLSELGGGSLAFLLPHLNLVMESVKRKKG